MTKEKINAMTLQQLRSSQLADFTGVNAFFILEFLIRASKGKKRIKTLQCKKKVYILLLLSVCLHLINDIKKIA
ncbi:hypothetical protein G1K86_02150 [Tenacibaculum finnmarkense]|nr:hypothetical protein [Tenacibaculum finnmarkense]